MTKILFICHGNICRSAAAEMVLKQMAREAGRKDLRIASAAATREEIGNDVYPPMKKALLAAGYVCEHHAARQTTRADYGEWDYIIGMDDENLHDMYAICEGNDPYDGGWWRRDISRKKPERKIPHVYEATGRRGEVISLLMDYTDRPGEVADPWYTGNFEETWQDVTEGCEGFLDYLKETQQI